MSRETRLLLATITVSAVVLVALSRFRFPERPAIVAASAPPLELLAARATYDELSGVVATVESRISPSLVVLRLAPNIPDEPRTLSDVLGSGTSDAAVNHVPGLRIGDTTAIAAVDGDARFFALPGDPSGIIPQRLATDSVRRLSLLHVSPDPGSRLRSTTLGELRTPTYVVVVEGTRAGLSYRPLFVGGGDRFLDPRWESPLLAVGAVALASPGSLIFSLEGQFLGSVVVEEGTLAIAEAREVVATADRLSALGSHGPFDAGISVQSLTTQLAAALGVDHGVLIAEVHPAGPVADVLQSLDVITTLNGRPVDSVDEFLLRLARRIPESDVTLTVIRDGGNLTLSLGQSPDAEPPGSVPLGGLDVTAQPGSGTRVVSVASGSAGATAGLRAGDVIRRAGHVSQPTPAQLAAIVQTLAPDAYLALTIDRAGSQRILAFGAIGGPADADAPR